VKKDDKQFENLDDNLLSGSGNDILMESQQEGDQKVGVNINHLQSDSLTEVGKQSGIRSDNITQKEEDGLNLENNMRLIKESASESDDFNLSEQ